MTTTRTYNRAPKGGLEYNGRQYKGGWFVPAAALLTAEGLAPIAGGAPEPVAVEPEPATTWVSSGYERLSNRGFHRSGGNGSGAARWWLRDASGNFVKIPSVRGDETFGEDLELDPGTYTLGTGRGKDAIRIEIEVE